MARGAGASGWGGGGSGAGGAKGRREQYGFSTAEKEAISRFEQRYIQQKIKSGENLIGQINYQKGEGERIEATFTTQKVFYSQRGGKMIHPDNYDVVERISKNHITLLVSNSGAMKMLHNPSQSEEKILSKHYYKAPKRKK